jgi:hypothetical protein
MSLTIQRYTVGTAVTLMSLPPGVSSATLLNSGTAVIYVGTGSTVSTTTGLPLAASASMQYTGYPASAPATLCAIAASGSATAALAISMPG